MSDLKRIQEIELEMLKNFHTLCTTNNLRYYIVGGTLLGAIRHGGFIPWDDDIDIAMPRDDYEKFINIYSKEMPSFLEVKSNPLNLDIVQIVNKNTLIELGKQEQGVFIDIFPVENMFDNLIIRNLHGILITAMLFVTSCVRIYKKKTKYLSFKGNKKYTKTIKIKAFIGKIFSIIN